MIHNRNANKRRIEMVHDVPSRGLKKGRRFLCAPRAAASLVSAGSAVYLDEQGPSPKTAQKVEPQEVKPAGPAETKQEEQEEEPKVVCDACGKVCKSAVGLQLHQRRCKELN